MSRCGPPSCSMVGNPRGPARQSMAPQPPAQPNHQLILKQVPPFTMLAKPPAPNYANYLPLSVMQNNGNYIAVNSKTGESNGGPILAVGPRPPLLSTDNNNTQSTFIAMENLSHSHQYLIPKPEHVAMHNYSKNEPTVVAMAAAAAAASSSASSPMTKRRSPAAARPTNHQRMKEEADDDEGEEIRPNFDPSLPLLEQIVKIDHNYPVWLPTPLPSHNKDNNNDDDDKESTISSDEKLDHNEEGEETETAAEGEDSVTRCICDFDHDDGYMISCDRCYVWQHVACVLPETPVANSLPDMPYLCDQCQPRYLDRHRARSLQIQRRKLLPRRNDSSDDSWSSNDQQQQQQPQPKKPVARRRAEAIPRRPNKREMVDGVRHKSEMRPKKLSSLLEGTIRSKLLKVGQKARREPGKGALMTSSMQTAQSVGRRTKLKRKFENKANQRRKGKNKERPDKGASEVRARAAAERQNAGKLRCRFSHSTNGEPMVITSCRVTSGEPIMELRGKLVQSLANLKSDILFHFRDKDGGSALWDATGRDNVLRHARRSCHPNAQLKMHKASQRLYLIAVESLERNQQVTLPHGSITDGAQTILRESCGKDCTYNPNLSVKLSPPRRRSRRCTMSEDSDRDGESPLSPTDRKLTREEKKIEQAMKIFAQMEKDKARKRDRTPSTVLFRRSAGPDSDKESPNESGKQQRRRRRRRKRRNSRKSRLPSAGSGGPGSSHLHSGDDSDVSTGDEFPSPRRGSKHDDDDDDDDKILGMDDAAGLLMALGSARHNPIQTQSTSVIRNSHEIDPLPSTPLSSTCLLVAAAVGPLAPGFKFPKTKKGMMNEWLGKSPEPDLSPSTESAPSSSSGHNELPLPPGAPKLSNLSNRLYYPPRENCPGFSEFGKKRWLRQAISEVTEPPLESPPSQPDNITPLKKRRLARESLTLEPPATPPQGQNATLPEDDTTSVGGDSPKSPGPVISAPPDLAERVRIMQRDYLAQQGIEMEPVDSTTNLETPMEMETDDASRTYGTSPQRAPENLTLPRPASPIVSEPLLAPPPTTVATSPTPAPADPRTLRRLRNKQRMDPRTKRFECNELMNGQLEADTTAPDVVDVKVEEDLKPIISFKDEFCGPTDRDLIAIEALKKLKKSSPPGTPPQQPTSLILPNDMKSDVSSTTTEDKAAPIRRKLSITEYLKRKKGSDCRLDTSQTDSIKNDSVKSEPSSPVSDDDISPLNLPTPTLPLPFIDNEAIGGRFKMEPTESERTRENLTQRLRREFGLVITDEVTPKVTEGVEDVAADAAAVVVADVAEPVVGEEIAEMNGFPEGKIDLPQSAIYPVGSSNPPNPFDVPFPDVAPVLPERRKFRK